jgi:hypothetical protein
MKNVSDLYHQVTTELVVLKGINMAAMCDSTLVANNVTS